MKRFYLIMPISWHCICRSNWYFVYS